MAGAEGANAVLDLADRGVDVHQRPTDPAGHLGQADRHRADRRQLARADRARRPSHQPKADQANGQGTGKEDQGKAKQHRQPGPMGGGGAKIGHRIQRGAVLEGVVGEQFNGLDVGQRIDNLPGDQRPRPSARLGAHPDTRQEITQDHRIGHDPGQKNHHHTGVNQPGHRDHGKCRCGGKDTSVDHFGGNIGNAARSLHLLLRDTPGEIIVKEGDRLPQSVSI